MAKTNTSLTLITPSIAADWLKQTYDLQRKIDWSQVRKIARAIKDDQWWQNGATIVFNVDDALIDGQHRLLAIIEAGRSVWSLVVRNIGSDERVFLTIGDEKQRRVTDFLKCPHAALTAAVLRILWDIHNGNWPGGKNVVPGTGSVMAVGKPYIGRIQMLIAPTLSAGRLTHAHAFCVFLALYYGAIAPVENQDRLTTFFPKVGDGVELEMSEPAYRLRARFIHGGSTVVGRWHGRALILKALHLHLLNKECKRIGYDPAREPFPELLTSAAAVD